LDPGIFEIKNLIHRYHDRTALQIDSLSIRRASIVGLIGPNGSGKSTLLKLLSFINMPSEGKIHFKGEPGKPFGEAVRFRVTLLTQEPYLMKRTVFNNIAYGLRIRKDTTELKTRIFQGLEMVGLPPGEFMNRQWYELSGGEAQRVALAARLVLKPEALLLDEPTASVDAASSQLIKDASIKAKEEWGTTLMVASHDLQWLYDICDETLHFFQGRILNSKTGNILFGPWQQFEDKSWGKTLKGGQRIVTSPPPDKNGVAMIKPFLGSTSAGENLKTQNNIKLQGVISRMILEQSTREILLTVPVDNFSFTLKLTGEQIQAMGIYPGSKVIISYDPDAVEWF